MALQPKYADAGAEAMISIDSRVVQNFGMRTAEVRRAQVESSTAASGVVTADERRRVVVEARAAGWIERLHVRAVGESVRRGDLLAEIYAPDLLSARRELALARELGDAELLAAARERADLLGAGGEADSGRRVAIRAPQDGVVTSLPVIEGARVEPGMVLFELTDLASVWLQVAVPEAHAEWMAPGLAAEVRLRALPGRVFPATVEHVYPQLDEAVRTLRLRLALENPDQVLKPGMYAEVKVRGRATGPVTLIPASALIRTGTRSVVMLAEGEGRFRPVAIEAGAERGEEIVVREGLEPGQRVVVSGQFLLDSEASMRGFYDRIDPVPAVSDVR